MDKLDLNQSGGVPLSTQILDGMQSAYRTVNELGKLAGDKVIVSGCIEIGGTVTDGFVIIGGELLKFKGTALETHVVVQEVAESPRGFEDGSAKPIIYERYATFGTADVQYAWDDFKRPLNLLQIEAKLTQLENMVPIGLVAIWDRPAEEIPAGWVEHTDLAGKTAVGHLKGDTNFGALGNSIGAAQVTLNISHLPEHDHNIYGQDNSAQPTGTASVEVANVQSPGDATAYYSKKTSKVGGNQAHSNIQPSRIVKYIRFVGFN